MPSFERKVRDVAWWWDGRDDFMVRSDRLIYRRRGDAWVPVASLIVGLGTFTRWLMTSNNTKDWRVRYFLSQAPIGTSEHHSSEGR